MGRQEDNDKSIKKRRRILIIIIIIIIILALITSCSCTSNFWGKIGNLFSNMGTHTVNNTTNDLEVIRNKDLIFDKSYLEMSLSDVDGKLTYSYRNIVPNKFSCFFSDATVATCYVEDGYVVINPKNEGTVILTLQTTVNGKIYEATATVKIGAGNRYIELASKEGVITLGSNNEKRIGYSLIGLSGEVVATSSDEAVATARVENGYLVVTGLKAGKAKITLSISFNGRTYDAVYDLTVKNGGSSGGSSTKPGSTGNNKPNGEENLPIGGDDPGDIDKPSDNPNGNEPDKPNTNPDNNSGGGSSGGGSSKPSNTSNLKKITIKGKDKNYTFDYDKNTNNYQVTVDYYIDNIDIIPSFSGVGSIKTCTIDGVDCTNLTNISLKEGLNKVQIVALDKNNKEITFTVDIYRPHLKIEAIETPHVIKFDDLENTGNVGFYVYTDNASGEWKKLTGALLEKAKEYLNITFAEENGSYKILNVQDNGDVIYIKINPKIEMLGKTAMLNMSYNLNNTVSDFIAILFEIEEDNPYWVVSGATNDIYNKLITDTDKKVEITLQTNVFNGKIVPTDINEADKKGIRLCSGVNRCVEVTYDSSLIDSLKYNPNRPDKVSDNFLPLDIMFNGPGVSLLNVKLITPSGEEKYLTITLNVDELPVLTLYSSFDEDSKQYGIFKEWYIDGKVNYETRYDYPLMDAIIDLDDYNNPYKYVVDSNGNINSCMIYPFAGYSKTKNSKNIDYIVELDADNKKYYIKDNVTKEVLNITNSTSLYAVYDEDNPIIKNEEQTLWIDVPLFRKTENNNQYDKENMIYPGAYGTYTAVIKNDLASPITITGLSLKEDTICIPDKGCLNIGYDIKHTVVGENTWNHYFSGKYESKYGLLNEHVKSGELYKIDTSPKITILGKDQAELVIQWKWIEINDEVDTLIGNKAAKGGPDKYRFTLGIIFESDVCSKINNIKNIYKDDDADKTEMDITIDG